MSADFEGSILPIVKRAHGGYGDFLGTGIVVSENVVLTCAHIFDDSPLQCGVQLYPKPVTVPPNWICTFVAGKPRSPTRIIEAGLDLCCLHFSDLPGAVPVRMARTPRVKGLKVVATGYVSGPKGLRRSLTDELKVIHQLQAEQSAWLQFGQVHGGLPRGFSGGPVVARTETGWKVLGVLQRGQEQAASSRFIASDPVLALLAEHGLRIEAEGLKAGSFSKETRALAPRSHMEAKNSIIITSSTVGDVTNNVTAPAHQPKISENEWHRLELLLAGKSNSKYGGKLARLRELVGQGQNDAAAAIWHELRGKLAGISEAGPLIAMMESLFSKGSRR